MCAVFGLLDFNNVFSRKQREHLVKILSIECEARGTDATGFAYTDLNKHTVYILKNNVPAHRLRLKLPNNANFIMGHTRMETQGESKYNYNNHPFPGRTHDTAFALAHNGVLYNDKSLCKKYSLPKTNIETDSYVAVQLIESFNTLEPSSLASMAEAVMGTFVFTILDSNNNFYFIKGDNPLAVYKFDSGFYVYASTYDILDTALKKAGLNKYSYSKVDVHCGDIIKIANNGYLTKSVFSNRTLSSFYGRYYEYFGRFSDPVVAQLREAANSAGIPKDFIDILIDWGYEDFEIYELLQTPDELMREIDILTGEFNDDNETFEL